RIEEADRQPEGRAGGEEEAGRSDLAEGEAGLHGSQQEPGEEDPRPARRGRETTEGTGAEALGEGERADGRDPHEDEEGRRGGSPAGHQARGPSGQEGPDGRGRRAQQGRRRVQAR